MKVPLELRKETCASYNITPMYPFFKNAAALLPELQPAPGFLSTIIGQID